MDENQRNEEFDAFVAKERKVFLIVVAIFAVIVSTWGILQITLPEDSQLRLVNMFQPDPSPTPKVWMR